MTPEEVTELIDVCAAAYRQQADPRDQMIWSAAVGDLSFSLARRAVVEWIRTSPYWPRPADLRERARLIAAQDSRERSMRGQIEARGDAPVVAGRTGADMLRHVLGRLKDAGSDPGAGKYLGAQRCGDIAEEAVHEWLHDTARPLRQRAFLRTQDAAPNPLYKPQAGDTGILPDAHRCSGCTFVTADEGRMQGHMEAFGHWPEGMGESIAGCGHPGHPVVTHVCESGGVPYPAYYDRQATAGTHDA